MQIIRHTADELVCQEVQPQFVKVLLWSWIIILLLLLLPLLILFIRQSDWIFTLLFVLLLLSVIYPAIALPLSEKLTLDKTTDQLRYEYRTVIGVRRTVIKLSDIQDIWLESNTNSASYRYYTLFVLLPAESQKLMVLYGKSEVERFYQQVRSFLVDGKSDSSSREAELD